MKTLFLALLSVFLALPLFGQSTITGVIPQYANGSIQIVTGSIQGNAAIDGQGNFNFQVISNPNQHLLTFTAQSGSPYAPFSLTVTAGAGVTNITGQLQQYIPQIGTNLGVNNVPLVSTNAQGNAGPASAANVAAVLGYVPAVAGQLITSGLMASYPLTDGTGTTPRDESGNGNTASFCPSPQTPIWTAQGLFLSANVNACFIVPASVSASTNVRTIEIVYTTVAPYGSNPQSAAFACYICSPDTSGLLLLSRGANGVAPATFVTTILGQSGTGTHTLIVSMDGTLDHWYMDGAEASYAAQSNSLGPITTGINPLWYVGWTSAFGGQPFQGTFQYVRFLNRPISASEAAQDSNTLRSIVTNRGARFGPQNKPNVANVWIAHGDSRTFGTGGTASYVAYIDSYTDVQYQTQVFAIQGFSASDLAAYTQTTDCFNFSPNSPSIIDSVWEGTNDIFGGASSATTWGYVANDGRTLHSCGFTSIIANDPSRIGLDAQEQAYDAYMRPLWQTAYDGFIDLGADVLIGGTNAYQNATYYAPDGVHLTDAGYQRVAQMFAREANYLKGSSLNNCTKVVTATYTVLDADGCTKFDPTGGSFTATLYDAGDFTGRVVYLQNNQKSGANTVTIAAAGSQTIDGSASITIPNGTMRILQVVSANAASPAGAGNNWHVLQ